MTYNSDLKKTSHRARSIKDKDLRITIDGKTRFYSSKDIQIKEQWLPSVKIRHLRITTEDFFMSIDFVNPNAVSKVNFESRLCPTIYSTRQTKNIKVERIDHKIKVSGFFVYERKYTPLKEQKEFSIELGKDLDKENLANSSSPSLVQVNLLRFC